jgi:response regulator NasT
LREQKEGEMSGFQRLRILVAAGTALARSDLRTQLGHLGHLIVAHTGSGREAVCLTRRLSPDLAAIDIELPDISGLETSRRISIERLCPIILLSPSSDPVWVREACSISAIQAFLVKPVYEENLEPVIELAVARSNQLEELSQLSRWTAEIVAPAKLRQEAENLSVRQHESLGQVRERSQQEARARRASLEGVAKTV